MNSGESVGLAEARVDTVWQIPYALALVVVDRPQVANRSRPVWLVARRNKISPSYGAAELRDK
jgi:hypothetical protein